MPLFESVADEYDRARPTYPPGVFEALGPLAGVRVVDVGAGTGIATRQLVARGASVVAIDAGAEVLSRAVAHAPGLNAVIADGTALPLRDASADLVCFAQSWHWMEQTRGCAEVHRVLAAGGRWSAWWSHARADGEDWFDRSWSHIESECPGTHRDQRDVDRGADVAASGLFDVADRVVVLWTRALSVDEWMTDQASRSYIATHASPQRLLDELRAVVEHHAQRGMMRVPYETWLWIGRKR